MESILQFESHSPAKQIFSSAASWKGFTIEENIFPAVTKATLPGSWHSLILNWSDPVSIALPGIHESVCDKGSVACLSTTGADTVLLWNQTFHSVCLHLSPQLVDEVLEIKDFRFLPQFNLTDPFLLEIATRLTSAASQDTFAEKVYAESLTVAGIVHMAKLYRGSKEEYYPKGRLSPYQLKQVIDFAYSYMQFNIGLHELAGLVHLSPYHFGRLFKQTVGLSPYQFILQLKIEYAKKLIKKNTGPISEIAYQLNFSDQSHFSNAFRKATGISPRQYLYS